jgi:hypothetical protein
LATFFSFSRRASGDSSALGARRSEKSPSSSSSSIVSVAVEAGPSDAPPVGLDSEIATVCGGSATESAAIGISNVLRPTPGPKTSVPEVAV